MTNENQATQEDKADAGCHKSHQPVPSDREKVIRCQTVIKAVNRDIEAMKQVGDERVEEIATLSVLLDTLHLQNADTINRFESGFRDAIKRNDLFVVSRNFVAGMDELADRLGEAEKIIQAVLKVVEAVSPHLVGNTYVGPDPTHGLTEYPLKLIVRALRDAILLKKVGLDAAKYITEQINNPEPQPALNQEAVDAGEQAPVYHANDVVRTPDQ